VLTATIYAPQIEKRLNIQAGAWHLDAVSLLKLDIYFYNWLIICLIGWLFG
jgi:hypothetical protein